MGNRGKKLVKCSQPGCHVHGFLSTLERSCLEDDKVAWMCPRHDDLRTIRENQAALRCNSTAN